MDTTMSRNSVPWTKRPIFRDPERYSPERFNRISEYQAGRLRHALLGIAGCGIVYGFDVETDDDGCCRVRKGAIRITCGLAIDDCGRMLYWPGGWVAIGELAGTPPDEQGRYTLYVHYAERGHTADDQCGCDPEDAAWVEESVVFSLKKGCEPECGVCPEHCRDCVSTNDYVCGRTGSNDNGIPVDECLPGICKEPGKLCHVGCGDWLYDADSGLALACVAICQEEGDIKNPDRPVEFCCTEPHICKFRRYVYRNPLLFELIQGCHYDLARVARLNFESWLRRDWDDAVPFNEFARLMHGGLNVRFSRPIRKSTITPASIFVTAVVREQDSFFNDVLRVPIDYFTYDDESDGFVRGATLHFPQRWMINQLDSELSRFNFGAIVEFTVRCSMLRDDCGCMPDARPLVWDGDSRGKCPVDKPAQQMPGDDFVVAFCVDRKRVDTSKDYENDSKQAT